jgi:hypothetical protein
LGLVGLAWSAFPAAFAAGATPVAPLESEPAEGGFRLRGSHGYSISVFAYSEGDGHSGTVQLIARRRGAQVAYRAPASVTAKGVHANLGGIATIDVIRRPSGRKKEVRPKCVDVILAYEPATYEGVIEFHGEEGYTHALASRVAQLPYWLALGPQGSCGGAGYGEVSGPGEPGARLRGISFAHGRSLSFQVNKNSSKARTEFTASLKERRDGIRIDRELAGVTGPSAFRFDPNLQTATLSPRGPFSGSASLSRSRNSFMPIWAGGLRLDFPGRQSVALAGPGVHVSLVHARFTRSDDSSVEIDALHRGTAGAGGFENIR